MANVVLVIHLLLALGLIVVVLVQRSEGGGLGIGGGGGGAMTGRAAGTAMGKLTWALAVAFLITSLTLTIFAARDSATGSVIERLGVPVPAAPEGGTAPVAPVPGGLLPPSLPDTPAAPPRAE